MSCETSFHWLSPLQITSFQSPTDCALLFNKKPLLVTGGRSSTYHTKKKENCCHQVFVPPSAVSDGLTVLLATGWFLVQGGSTRLLLPSLFFELARNGTKSKWTYWEGPDSVDKNQDHFLKLRVVDRESWRYQLWNWSQRPERRNLYKKEIAR